MIIIKHIHNVWFNNVYNKRSKVKHILRIISYSEV